MRQSELFSAVRRLALVCSLLSAGCTAGPVKLSSRLPRVYVQAPTGTPKPAIVTRLKSGGYWYVKYYFQGPGGFPIPIIAPHPARDEGRFPGHALVLYGTSAFLLEERPDFSGEERYLLHGLDRESGEVKSARILRTLTVPRLGAAAVPWGKTAKQAGSSYAHVWSGGRLLFTEPGPQGPLFSAYDPLTDEVVRLQTDAGFPPPFRGGGSQYVFGEPDAKVYLVGWELLGIDWDRHRKVMDNLEGYLEAGRGRRNEEAMSRDLAYIEEEDKAKQEAEVLLWGGALEEGKVLWRQSIGEPRSPRPEYRALHVVPGTSLLKVSWDYYPEDHDWRGPVWRELEKRGMRGGGLLCGGRPLTGKYRVLRLETGEVVDSGTYDAPGPLAWLNCGCKQGLICWDGSDVVLRDTGTFREIARRTVPHPVANVYGSYLGDDVWMFCTFGDGLFLDVFTPGLAEQVASEGLTPQACLPPLPKVSEEAREETAQLRVVPGGALPSFGVRKVGEHFIVGPWSPPNPFTSYPNATGWFFLEVTAEGKFSGTSLLSFPKGEQFPMDGVTSLLVDGSHIWLVDGRSLTLIDWEGTREKGQ